MALHSHISAYAFLYIVSEKKIALEVFLQRMRHKRTRCTFLSTRLRQKRSERYSQPSLNLRRLYLPFSPQVTFSPLLLDFILNGTGYDLRVRPNTTSGGPLEVICISYNGRGIVQRKGNEGSNSSLSSYWGRARLGYNEWVFWKVRTSVYLYFLGHIDTVREKIFSQKSNFLWWIQINYHYYQVGLTFNTHILIRHR